MAGKVDFTGVRWTNLVTLTMRAQESREGGAVLGDTMAEEVVRGVDYDFGSLKMRLTSGDRYLVALRARQLDRWVRDFLGRHPAATVVQLGCGMDSRAFRVRRGEGVWFDVDYPDVVALRRGVYPESERYRLVGSSVVDGGWWEQVPAGGPVLVVAEGLFMYLREQDVREVLGRVVGRFDTGEVLFDGVSRWAVKAANLMPPPFTDFGMGWAVRDGHEVERWVPRLRLDETVPVLRDCGDVPLLPFRVGYRLVNAVPALRDAMRLFRYSF